MFCCVFISAHFSFVAGEDANHMFVEEVSPSATRLVLTNLQLSDSGVYACVVDTKSSVLNLVVISKLYSHFVGELSSTY